VSHLLFVDDSLLFFKGSINQATVIKSVLDKYEKETGAAGKLGQVFHPLW
jgi:hypothetical protein